MDWKNLSAVIRTLGSLAGLLVFLGGVGSWAFDALPVAKASEVTALKIEVATVKTTLMSIQVSQKESQELQLMERIDGLADRLKRITPDTVDYSEFRIQRVAAQQRLRQVQEELASVRGGRQ